MATAERKNGPGFSFIRRGHSIRTKEKRPREEESALSRWLRELRAGVGGGSENDTKPEAKVTAKSATLDRSNPIYHSEGKGLRARRAAKDRRRHSFNQRPQPLLSNRCCLEKEDGTGKKLRPAAMTGGTAKSSSHYIINTSPPERCRPSVQEGHDKGASWLGEDPLVIGTRPHRSSSSSFTHQLKTVMERCEKMPPGDKFLPKVDREGKTLGDSDYSIPSPPERDLPHLDHYTKYNETRLSQLSIDGGYDGSQTSLTRAELEQYTRAYEDVRPPSHSQQPSYAQSEGYHSYVSSADSTTTTPFLDRLRRESVETSVVGGIGSSGGGRDSSASSGSSSETLKWHGSLSDVSSTAGHTQHIAHSARVPMPQRHHSESVLYLDPWPPHNNINTQMRRLFPVTTYEPTSPRQLVEHYSTSRSPPKLSVAERICEIERQSSQTRIGPPPLGVSDVEKRGNSNGSARGITDHASLKAIQKKALLSFYERHHSAWKSEPQLTTPSIPPQPPPRPQPPPPAPSRRSSSASDYAGAIKREMPRSNLDLSKVESNGMRESKHQHRYVENRIETMQTNYCDPLSELWDKKAYIDMRRYSTDKKLPLDAQLRAGLLSPPLPNKGKRPHHAEQPRSLDSNLSIVETNNEVNKPGPQTPTHKKYTTQMSNGLDSKVTYKNLRENFLRAGLQQGDLVKNSPERQSLRFTTTTHSLLVNGKIANAVHNGKISPPSRKANLVRTPSDVVRRVSYSTGIHHAEPMMGKQHPDILGKHGDLLGKQHQDILGKHGDLLGKQHQDILGKHGDLLARQQHCEPNMKQSPPADHPSKSPPSLPPHCPPTTLQKSQSKAQYLNYRREPREKEKGVPNFQGSYKRTMSPSGGRIIDSSEKSKDSELEIKSDSNDINQIGDDKKAEERPASQGDKGDTNCDKETASKTLPRNYALSIGTQVLPKRSSRPPRAQSDPTSSAKADKKTVSASTQHNLDEVVTSDGEEVTKPIAGASVGRSQSDRTGEIRRETERIESSTSPTLVNTIINSNDKVNATSATIATTTTTATSARVSDAASQTTPAPSPPPPPVLPRRQLQEEIECDQLSRDLASQLSPSHKLHGILVPGPDVKRTTDYVTGLFRMDFNPTSRNSIAASSESSQTNGKETEPLSPTNAYFTTSECKARLMSLASNIQADTTTSSMSSLQQKKEELMMRLSRKLSVLRAESVAVTEETAVNEALGQTVTERVERVARPQELAKFRLHVKEVGHITSLLLSLSGRLARAENALLALPSTHHDRKALEEKRDKLLAQLNEAKQLKSNIDQRSGGVSTMLYNYLSQEEYTDYDHFINMKSKLLVDSREIAEKIQLGEEQLAALKETLDQGVF
ncbi:shroom isoform X4 [Rhodnius prolixus]|uniref:shroom isoform X4 n=1 Tax=Rhodnius prolixus TaxID=13249 RepID=UPI003D189C6B